MPRKTSGARFPIRGGPPDPPRTPAGWLAWADRHLSKLKREHSGARPWAAFQYDGRRAVSAPSLLAAIQRAYQELTHRPPNPHA
jgi:hypothetical protein